MRGSLYLSPVRQRKLVAGVLGHLGALTTSAVCPVSPASCASGGPGEPATKAQDVPLDQPDFEPAGVGVGLGETLGPPGARVGAGCPLDGWGQPAALLGQVTGLRPRGAPGGS